MFNKYKLLTIAQFFNQLIYALNNPFLITDFFSDLDYSNGR